jgi:hypothetical protein
VLYQSAACHLYDIQSLVEATMPSQRVRFLILSSFLCALTFCISESSLFTRPAPDEVPFEHVIIEANFEGSDCKGAADINGDGYPDVIAATAHELAWYEYPTWAKHTVAYGTNFTTDMQVPDVNNDGVPDIVVPDGPRGKLTWFENPRGHGADPATDPWVPHLIGYQKTTFAHDVQVGDVNGDGKLDVVTRNGSAGRPGNTILWLQKSSDSWVRVELPTVVSGEGTAIADINRDGRLDVIQNGYWLECPKDDPASGTWIVHEIDRNWPDLVGATVADLNRDGRPDLVLSPAESKGKLAWYEAPPDPVREKWIEHVIDPDVEFIHTFKVADVDNDGNLDIVTAEMLGSGYHKEIHSRARVSVYLNRGDSLHWKQQVVATTGGHNLRVADLNSDGTVDIISSNWESPDFPYHPLEAWINKSAAKGRLPLDRWTYIPVDDHKGKWGDFEKPAWMRYFGLAAGDVTGDSYKDIVSGRYFYRNPGGDMTGLWARVDFGMNVDGMLMVDVDGDGQLDVIAEHLPDVYWLKPLDKEANTWKALKVASIPTASHVNGQGYKLAQLVPGPKQQILLASQGLYYITIPEHPENGNWPVTCIAKDATDEGVDVGDFNDDGRLDVAAGYGDGRQVAWWENAGNGQADWVRHQVGSTAEWKDRTSVADLNGDRRPDIIVSEESVWKGDSIYWFENPGDPSATSWTRHTLVTQFTTNSLDVADMNDDGLPDIISAEHRGTKKLQIWESLGSGSFREHIISTGRENHLGAQVADMDGDGDLDIVGIAWDGYPCVHLWRNDAYQVLGGARTVATPIITPNGGNSTQPFEVQLSCATPGTKIRYTLDGTSPTTSSALYAEPLHLTGSATLTARAFRGGMNDSAAATAKFTTTYHY